jgi:hypothetical protein
MMDVIIELKMTSKRFEMEHKKVIIYIRYLLIRLLKFSFILK